MSQTAPASGASGPTGPGSRSPRSIGRVHVVRMLAPPLDEPLRIEADGCRVERIRSGDGTTSLFVVDDGDLRIGEVHVYSSAHGDPFFGKYSLPGEHECYGSKLEVHPAARGRSIGRQLVRAARCVAFEEGGRGLSSMVDPGNAASVRCHELEGFVPTVELWGVRLGGRTLWLRRRTIRP